MENNNISTRAMLVSLSISRWGARKYDQKISKDVADEHKTTENAGRYNKNLLPFGADSHKKVYAAIGQAKAEHYTQTLPWTDEGWRILAATNYMTYTEAMRKHRNNFEKNVGIFLAEFPALHKKAKDGNPTMYRAEDYPSVEQLKYKYAFNLRVVPLPAAEDFRVSLGNDAVEQIRSQIEHDTHEAVTEAVRDLYLRLHKAVHHLVDTLGKKDARFYHSLVGNLRDLCELVPRLNFTNDPKLEELRAQIEMALVAHEVDELKEDKKLRSKVAKSAAKIESDLAAFMGR
jgi:hypothetical protein